MPTRDDAPIGAPCWIDLFTSDLAASRAFYEQLLGWGSEEPDEEFGGYVNFDHGDARVAGAMTNSDGNLPDVWSVYLRVADLDASLGAVEANGGKVIVPAGDVGELGRFAVTADVGGAAIGLWEPGTHRGFGVLDEPGAPSWFELHTRTYEPTLDYYRTVFGWEIHTESDVPDFRYSTLGEGDGALAGVMDASVFLPEGVPAHWSVYFQVPDLDQALEQVVALGGAKVMGPDDTPYGRLAMVTDPTGATFKLQQP